MNKAIILLLTTLPFIGLAQTDFCERSFGESYFPLHIGLEKHLTWGDAIYIEKITDTTILNGVKYFNYEQDFGEGTSYDLLLRKQNDTVFMYNVEQKKDIILLIERPIKGVKWESAKVIETDGFFESPYCDYPNLLVVENKYPNGTTENRYYKKGVGLVAVKEKGGIKGMLIPSKEESKAMSKPFSAYGCENKASKEEINNCTMTFIHSFLINELSKRNLKQPKEDGILQFKLHFDHTGKITKVDRLNSLKGGNQVHNAIVEILYSLPEFIPLRTSEKKTIGTKYSLSIPIKTK